MWLALLPSLLFGEWVWRNPFPHGLHLRAVHFIERSVGLAAGEAGLVAYTVDGGISTVAAQPVSENLRGAWLVNAGTGFAVGESGTIIRTRDSAASWQRLTSGTDRTLNAVCFPVGAATGYACGAEGTLLKSTDQGESWLPLVTGRSEEFFAVDFPRADSGFVAGADGLVLATRDGGISWDVRPVPARLALFGLSFLTPDTGYACGDSGRIFRTDDRGRTWRVESIASCALFAVRFPVAADTGFVCGDAGLVARTTDGGQSWLRQVDDPALGQLCGLSFATDNRFGSIVGDYGLTLRTFNAGGNWVPLWAGFRDDVADMTFPTDACTGFVAVPGAVLKTIDQALDWRRFPVGRPNRLAALSFSANCMSGFAAGSAGLIFRTTDGGATWRAESCPGVTGDYCALDFPFDAGLGFAVTANGRIVKTRDSGATWFPIAGPPVSAISAARFLTSATGFVAGPDSAIYRTLDGGVSWRRTPTLGPTVHDFSFPGHNALRGYACGDDGLVLRTTNRGIDWVPVHREPGMTLRRVRFPGRLETPAAFDTGFAVGDAGVVLRTLDGGVSWQRVAVPAPARAVTALAFPDGGRIGYIAGEGGFVLATRDGGGLGIDGSKPAVEVTTLRVQPNPFRGRLRLSCELPVAGRVTLQLYDASGRRRASEQLGVQPVGTLEHDFVTEVPRGVYFLRLKTAGGSQGARVVCH